MSADKTSSSPFIDMYNILQKIDILDLVLSLYISFFPLWLLKKENQFHSLIL